MVSFLSSQFFLEINYSGNEKTLTSNLDFFQNYYFILFYNYNYLLIIYRILH